MGTSKSIHIVSDNDRKVWPDIQTLPDRTAVCAENLEIEAEWRRKGDMSPPSAHTHQYVPLPYYIGMPTKIQSPEVKYFEQDIVWKHIDRCCMSIMLACAVQSQYSLQSPT